MGRKRIADMRKRELVEAFFEVVAQKGFGKTTMREVAETAGFTQGMIHHYFGNRDAMVLAVMDYVRVTVRTEILRDLSKQATAAGRLKYAILWLTDPKRFDSKFDRVWIELLALSKTQPAAREAIQEGYKETRDLLAEIIAEGVKSGEFRKVKPLFTAELLLASIEGATMLRTAGGATTPHKSMNKQTIDLFTKYLMREDRAAGNEGDANSKR